VGDVDRAELAAFLRRRRARVQPADVGLEALHDPHRDQWVVLYTAPPGTRSHDALRLLKVVGTHDLAARGWETG
jgi:hypothetical protein